jgi:undecaprenyl-diphosphatase
MDAVAYSHDVRGWPLGALVGGTAAAVLAGAVAASGEVPGWEQAIFHAINDLPDALRGPLWLFQLAGVLLVPLAVAAVAAAMRRYRLAASLVVLIPLKLVVERLIIKQVVERQRPGTSICHLEEACGHFRDVPLSGLSFVSGHAIITWSVATLLWPYLSGWWRWVPVAVAVLNAVARIYLGAHNPLDLVGGAGIGVALGAALTLIFGRPVPARATSGSTSTSSSASASP